MNETVEFIKFFARIIVASALFIASILIPCTIMEDISCAKTWESSGFESRYNPLTGCMLKVDSRWIPDKSYREVK